MKTKELKAAAKELNELLFDANDPQIDMKGDDDSLKNEIVEAVKTCLAPSDKVSAATQAVIDELIPQKKADKKEMKKKTTPEPEPEPEEEEDLEVDSLTDRVEEAETMAELKELVNENAEFKTLKRILGTFKKVAILKAAMQDILAASEKPEPEEKKAPVKSGKAPAKTEAPTEKKKFGNPNGKCTLVEKIAFFTPLIESGKFSQKELIEKGIEKYPHLTKSTLQTFLTDSKNAKYNRFASLVVLNGEKMTFEGAKKVSKK